MLLGGLGLNRGSRVQPLFVQVLRKVSGHASIAGAYLLGQIIRLSSLKCMWLRSSGFVLLSFSEACMPSTHSRSQLL